jgi:hypothetical protein
MWQGLLHDLPVASCLLLMAKKHCYCLAGVGRYLLIE